MSKRMLDKLKALGFIVVSGIFTIAFITVLWKIAGPWALFLF